jgi:hypothetical protein
MDPDAGPQPPDRDHRPDRPVRDDVMSWLRRPLTMRHLCALGVIVVGGGIPAGVLVGGWASLWLGLMVIAIIAMAMAHDRGRSRKRRRPRASALKRTRGGRRSAAPGRKGPRRTGVRRGGGTGEKTRGGRDRPASLGPGGDPLSPPPAPAREGAPAHGEPPGDETKKQAGH